MLLYIEFFRYIPRASLDNLLFRIVQLLDPNAKIPALSVPAPAILSPLIVMLFAASIEIALVTLSLALIIVSSGSPDSDLITRSSVLITKLSV